jgi:hypothetical protein
LFHSSAPLTTLVEGRATVFGVFSFGEKDCQLNKPMAFARVTEFLDWILYNTDAGNFRCRYHEF